MSSDDDDSVLPESLPWIEKYRPSSLKDVVLDDVVRLHLKSFLKKQANSHLIITGVPGIGKTSTVRCIAREILGENMEHGYLELNAAEDRGVRSIDAVVPPFCKKIKFFDASKIVFFDEADNLTNKCQHDINTLITKYGHNTRFIFTCNDSNRISKDIQSVCHIVLLKRLSKSQITQYLRKICSIESIPCDESGLDMICYISDGDMRKAINNLQLTCYSFRAVKKETVLRICKVPDPQDIMSIINQCLNQDYLSALKHLQIIIDNGYYFLDIVTSFEYVLNNAEIADELRLQLLSIAKQTKITLSVFVRSQLQIEGMLARFVIAANQASD